MKKFVLLLSVLVCGCTLPAVITQPSKTIENPKCSDFSNKTFEILQTLSNENGALAYVCKQEYSTSCLPGMVVFLKKPKNTLFYDEQIISPSSEEKCLIIDGTYEYTTKNKVLKTVPKLKMIDKYIPNPEYEKWEKEQKPKE